LADRMPSRGDRDEKPQGVRGGENSPRKELVGQRASEAFEGVRLRGDKDSPSQEATEITGKAERDVCPLNILRKPRNIGRKENSRRSSDTLAGSHSTVDGGGGEKKIMAHKKPKGRCGSVKPRRGG